MKRWSSELHVNPGVLSLVVGAGALSADMFLKQWAQETLTHPLVVTPWLCLAVQHNSGLFLGVVPLASGALGHLLLLGAAILWTGWRMASTISCATRMGYALVTGGLAGNALDRIDGAVVDFFGFGPVVDDKWIFVNLADVAMVLGALVLTVVLVLEISGKANSTAQGRD